MKLIIAGSRHFDPTRVARQIPYLIPKLAAYLGLPPVTGVVTGDQRGVDRAARDWTRAQGWVPDVKDAKWSDHGPVREKNPAGPIRNGKMAEAGEALLLIWDGVSPGSADMLRQALERGLPVYEHLPGGAFRVHHAAPAAPTQLSLLETP